jgi:sterol desaturase/sphingolipid hydroxylase (fatty acid hydroxylase superfamily)
MLIQNIEIGFTKLFRTLGLHSLIILFCHYSFIYLKEIFGLSYTTCTFLCFFLFYDVVMFGLIFLFECLDVFLNEDIKNKIKLKDYKSLSHSKKEMLFINLRNEIILFTLLILVLPYFIKKDYNENIIFTYLWIIPCYIIFETLFYFGHRFMHFSTWHFNNTHSLHHSTYATNALSTHFMELIDYFLEG